MGDILGDILRDIIVICKYITLLLSSIQLKKISVLPAIFSFFDYICIDSSILCIAIY